MFEIQIPEYTTSFRELEHNLFLSSSLLVERKPRYGSLHGSLSIATSSAAVILEHISKYFLNELQVMSATIRVSPGFYGDLVYKL